MSHGKVHFPVVLLVVLASISFAGQRQQGEWNRDRPNDRHWS